MEKKQLKDALLRAGDKTGFISQKELVSFTGQSDAYVRSHYLRELKQVSEIPGGLFFIPDVAEGYRATHIF